MNKVTTVTVSEELAGFIEARIAAGDYASEAEVVEAALALLRDEVDGLAAIRAAIEEGEASGEPQPFDADQFLEEMHRKYGA
jgi:antitoxin ParD1/3/4